MVIAAAAAMLFMSFDAHAPQATVVRVDVPSPALVAESPGQELPALQPAVPSSLPPATQTPTAAPQGPVPLLPEPVDDHRAFIARRDQALQKLVELYPTLVHGPQTDDIFVAAILLNEDGTVLNHAMQTATPQTVTQAHADMDRRVPMPMYAGEPVRDLARKATKTPDGRTLRGAVAYHHMTVPAHYDPARSSLRVVEIMRPHSAGLRMAPTNGVMSYVTVLLSESGTIERQSVDHVGTEEMRQRIQMSGDQRALAVARRLGISVDQIGLMGFTTLRDDSARGLVVDFAWQRRADETGPVYRQGNAKNEAGIDTAVALALVERVMPDAFMGDEVEHNLGRPVVMLTQQGEIVRTARLKTGKDVNELVRELVPGFAIGSGDTAILTNNRGQTAAVYFVWQASPDK
jgi:hypothetical protein